MTNIGIMAQIGLDGRGFRAGLLGAEKSAMQFARRLAGYFTLSAISFKLMQLARETVQWASGLQDTADSIGLTFEEIQKLDYIAEKSGGSIDSIVGAMRRLSSFRLEALSDPSGKSARLAESLGVSRRELEGMKGNWQLFARFANIIRDNDFGASQLAIVNELFGRGATELIPAMKSGINAMAEEAANLGLVLKNDVGKELDRLDDVLKEVAKTMKIIAAPPLAEFGRGIQALLTPFRSKQTGRHLLTDVLVKPFEDVVNGVLRGGVGIMEEAAGRGIKPIKDIIEAMGGQKKAPIAKALGFAPPSDELARIGGFVGGTGNRQVSILQGIERNTDRTAKAAADTARKLENM